MVTLVDWLCQVSICFFFSTVYWEKIYILKLEKWWYAWKITSSKIYVICGKWKKNDNSKIVLQKWALIMPVSAFCTRLKHKTELHHRSMFTKRLLSHHVWHGLIHSLTNLSRCSTVIWLTNTIKVKYFILLM